MRLAATTVVLLAIAALCSAKLDPLPGCQTFHNNQCNDIKDPKINTDDKFEASRWYTPLRGDPDYKPGYQDYGVLIGKVHLEYTADRKSATVTVVAKHRYDVTLTYIFDNQPSSNPVKTVTASTQKGPMQVVVKGSDGSQLWLEPVDFVWYVPAVTPLQSGDYRSGQKGAIVEMFGWPHSEIELECPFLAQQGYMGVKVFPTQEQVMSNQPFNDFMNPWYFMYQPMSYRLQGRMGTRDQLRSMIHACRSVGVRVYADAVVNHMVGCGNDANPRHRNDYSGCSTWPNKNSSFAPENGGPSPSYTQCFTYEYGLHTDQPAMNEFPAAMYGPTDFHCERSLGAWDNPHVLNAGWLTGLVDLATEKDNVRERIADFLTDLLSIGFSGFRIDAAKHIHPDDLVAIFMKIQRNMGGSLPDDFISFMEVLLGNEAGFLICNVTSGYNYAGGMEKSLLAAGMTQTDINKIKIWNSGYPKEPEKGTCGTISLVRSAIQHDDADQQNPGSSSRDMASSGCVLIQTPNYHGCSSIDEHRKHELELFNSPPGAKDNDNDYPIRLVLSSYYWQNGSLGIPDGKSDCSKCEYTCQNCKTTPYIKAHNPTSTGYDKDYTRVHRDSAIIGAMRKWMKLPATIPDMPVPHPPPVPTSIPPPVPTNIPVPPTTTPHQSTAIPKPNPTSTSQAQSTTQPRQPTVISSSTSSASHDSNTPSTNQPPKPIISSSSSTGSHSTQVLEESDPWYKDRQKLVMYAAIFLACFICSVLAIQCVRRRRHSVDHYQRVDDTNTLGQPILESPQAGQQQYYRQQ